MRARSCRGVERRDNIQKIPFIYRFRERALSGVFFKASLPSVSRSRPTLSERSALLSSSPFVVVDVVPSYSSRKFLFGQERQNTGAPNNCAWATVLSLITLLISQSPSPAAGLIVMIEISLSNTQRELQISFNSLNTL